VEIPTHERGPELSESVDTLLAQVRARRRLPPARERRQIRERAGVSLRSLASVLDVSHATVRGWEQGATPRERRAEYADVLAELKRAAL
jgi:DNA-binding transcriptional regulator YiaG